MIMIQFVDARTGETMTEIGSRQWPAVPRVGDQIVFTNPVPKCKVTSASWIDLLQHHGNSSPGSDWNKSSSVLRLKFSSRLGGSSRWCSVG
jgi:hypothetical protein